MRMTGLTPRSSSYLLLLAVIAACSDPRTVTAPRSPAGPASLRAAGEKPGAPAAHYVRNPVRPGSRGGVSISASVAANQSAADARTLPAWEPTLGTNAHLGDDVADSVPIGFPFTFYGKEYEDIYLSSNGNVTLNRDSYDYEGLLPYEDFALIAAATGDWQPDSGTVENVYYATVGEAPRRRFVVTWNSVRLYRERHLPPSTARSTFQLQLAEGTSAIQFSYKEIGETRPDIRVGISSGQGEYILTAEGEAVAALQGTSLCYTPDGAGGYQVTRTVCAWGSRGVSAGGPYAGVEGAPITFDGAGSAEPGAGALSYAWDFGDGNAASGSPTPAHVYADGGSFTAALTVTDARGRSGTERTAVTVANVAPSVAAGADVRITSGETFALRGTFGDPGVRDMPWAYSVDWGDGASVAGSLGDPSAPIAASQRYLRAGTYAVAVRVTDKDGDSGVDTVAVTVQRLPVAIDLLPHRKYNKLSLGGRNDWDDDDDDRKGGGWVPVAILSTPAFDARQVYPASAVLGTTPLAAPGRGHSGKGRKDEVRYDHVIQRHDVNRDRRQDLILWFRRADLVARGDLSRSTTSLTLFAETFDGRQIEGRDELRVVR